MIINIIKYTCTVFWFTNIVVAQIPKLYINEFLTSNAHVNYDPAYGHYSDWIELYNSSDNSLNINGYTVTDDPNNPQKFRIQDDLLIEPFDYLILWADGEDNGIHTNFKLSVEGEYIGVFKPDGSVVDTITYIKQKTDISYGRVPDDLNKWVYYSHPTPKSENGQNGYSGLIVSDAPTFSHSSGFFSAPVHLELTSESGAEIRYTLDGSEPDESSLLYNDPINLSDRIGEPNYFSEIPTNINSYSWIPTWQPPRGEVFKATVIRVRAYHPDKIPSDIKTHTYFVNPMINDTYKDIPIISLVSDEKHLFSDSAGIYVPGNRYNGEPRSGNYATDWTRPASIEYFNRNRDLAFNQEFDIRIQGGSSRLSPQKSFHVIARNKYGVDIIDYPLFQDSDSKANVLEQHKRFILRAWGTVWNQGMINDPLAQLSYAKSQLDIQDYYPVIVFINGEYWGLQEIREANRTPYYYQEHYGIDRDNPGIDILFGSAGAVGIDEGDTTHWQHMFDFLSNNDISLSENYRYVQEMMDVENFIDYIGHCVFLGKRDWPGGNEAFWRPRTNEGRWKWIQYDMDLCFYNTQYDMIRHVLQSDPDDREPHGILIHLINNESFKIRFINWFMDRLNSDFKSEIIQRLHNSLLNDLYPHLDEHQNRWSKNDSNFGIYTSFIRNFISKRPEFMISHIRSFFGLDSLAAVLIDRSSADGIVKINSLIIDDSTAGVKDSAYPWNGSYFKNLPVTLFGLPNAGYTFSHWEGDIYSVSDSISLILDDSISVTAVFKPAVMNTSLRINEILADNNNNNVDEMGDYDDWIELYNASNDTIVLSNFYLTDDFSNLTKWRFPKSNSRADSIFPEELKLIWCDGEPEEGPNHVNFSLNKEGEQVGLIQIVGTDTVFIDSLTFPRQWRNISYGRVPDGTGQWKYLIPPSPGRNNKYKSISVNGEFATRLYQNFPNPFTSTTIIPFFNSRYDRINLKIFDLKGRLVRNLINMKQLFGYHEITFDGKDNNGNNLSSGLYFYQLQINEIQRYGKMLYIK